VIIGEDRAVIRRTLAAALAGLLSGPVAAAAVPADAADGRAGRPTRPVVIDVVKVNGSGCRPGTATVAVSADNTAFTVTYSGYLAQVGAGTNRKDLLKNCRLKLKVSVPKGFTYTISGIDYRGFAHLEPGATGRLTASYSFQGPDQGIAVNHRFPAPLDDDWQVPDTATAGFGPCGKQRPLTIDTELAVGAGTSDPAATSLLSMDSTDGSVHSTYHLGWKTC
jgi:Domain of unknown function (DUF4360)